MDPVGVLVVEGGAHQASKSRTSRIDALEHIANRPIADHVLDAFEAAGVSEVVVTVPSDAARDVRESLASRQHRGGVQLHYVDQHAPVDFGGALRLAAPLVGDSPCVIHSPSGLLAESLTPLVDRLSPDAPDLVVTMPRESAGDQQPRVGRQRTLHLVETVPAESAPSANGVWTCGPRALRNLVAESWRCGEDIDMRHVAELITTAGGDFHVRLVDDWTRYAGDSADLLELNRIALDRLRPELRRPAGEGNRIEGSVEIHAHAWVQQSVILGPVVIGAGARISDAYIGPYTSIGAGAQVEGAEIERSIISPGASIAHVSRRLIASVVGRNARVFQDFSLPRALRIRVGEGTEVGLC
jgi:glucose-1-phosphate thymidylyltransferase